MIEWLTSVYPWLKALHIISVISWMAGLLYLPRLFAYHAAATPGGEASKTFKTMERRLLRAIMNPAMGATYLFGILLAVVQGPALWQSGWFHAKLLFVVALTVLHHLMAAWRKDFAADRNHRPARFYKIMNEVPTILMIGIVIFVVVRPF
ncbi:MAG: protoporphyrinogen oxidase HemJ [Alphaproteobacteria bacterium]|nr:protoporphyrinogen oxidase HemJ [Alphaproteobacteria bacterium]